MGRHQFESSTSQVLGKALVNSAALRALSLVLGFANSALIVHLVVGAGGSALYAAVALSSSIAGLLPFADLGIGYAIVNESADLRANVITPYEFQRKLRGVTDILIIIGALLVGAAGVAYRFGFAAAVLGNVPTDASIQLAVAVNIALVGVGLPLGVGVRILQGLGRVALANGLALLIPALSIMITLVNRQYIHSPALYAVSTQIGVAVAAAATFAIALKSVGIGIWAPFRSAADAGDGWRTVRSLGLAAMVVNIGLTIAFQLDRIVLGHESGSGQVAEYSVVAQIYGPVFSVIAAASQNLWSHYRTQLVRGNMSSTELLNSVRTFAVVGLGGGAVVVLGGKTFTSFVAGGAIHATWPTLFAAAALTLAMSVHQPGAMLSTSPSAMRIQALLVVVMAAVNLALSIFFARWLGASGPYLASFFAVLSIQFVPVLWLGRTEIAKSRRNFSIARLDAEA